VSLIPSSINDDLQSLVKDTGSETITVGEIVNKLSERGFGMLMMLFALPMCTPIPTPPGTTTLFSLPLLFLSVQMLSGRRNLWIPKKLSIKTIKTKFLKKLVDVVSPYLKKLERYVKPRLPHIYSKSGEIIIGFMWLMFSISIAVPLPMTNFLPAVGILVSSFGLLNRDGYIIYAGFGIGIIGCAITFSILFLGGNFLAGLF